MYFNAPFVVLALLSATSLALPTTIQGRAPIPAPEISSASTSVESYVGTDGCIYKRTCAKKRDTDGCIFKRSCDKRSVEETINKVAFETRTCDTPGCINKRQEAEDLEKRTIDKVALKTRTCDTPGCINKRQEAEDLEKRTCDRVNPAPGCINRRAPEPEAKPVETGCINKRTCDVTKDAGCINKRTCD